MIDERDSDRLGQSCSRDFSAFHRALMVVYPSVLERMIGDTSCSRAASQCGGRSPSFRMTCKLIGT